MRNYRKVFPLCLTSLAWFTAVWAAEPVANFEVSVDQLKIHLQNKSTDDDGDQLKYKWYFGDGATSKKQNPGHTYDKAGVYKITLKASDGTKTVSYARKIRVNSDPVADFDVVSQRKFNVAFGSKSSDPDGDKLSYRWSFGDGATSKELNPEHLYGKAGTYSVVLKVSDGVKTVKTTKKIVVSANQVPVADFNAAEQKALKIRLENSSSDADGDNLKYKWYFGDGTTSAEVNPEHIYKEPGTYDVTLKANFLVLIADFYEVYHAELQNCTAIMPFLYDSSMGKYVSCC